jgi:hypothetical protein
MLSLVPSEGYQHSSNACYDDYQCHCYEIMTYLRKALARKIHHWQAADPATTGSVPLDY